MSEYVLETRQLTKKYRGIKALDNISISLKPGKIYGLIGRNGAGKTTFMRMIAGLSFATEGNYSLFGQSGAKIKDARKRIGFMIEYPAINTSMTAKDNMSLHRMIKGIPNKEKEDELLDLVGLRNSDKKKTRNFSLGMKQRLGIAIALVGSPEFLVLDEPINGLDPMGIVDIRNLLKYLCEEKNITILLSSHNLSELYQVATDYIILDSGRVVKQITSKELDEECREYIFLRTNNPEKSVSIIESELNIDNYMVMPDKSIHLYNCVDKLEEIAEILHINDIVVTELSVRANSLEKYYMNLVGEDKHD
ncbi:ABC transporter ATP-binding protein [Peptostreptococcus faecalis]|uniref:ABC transporter ATP-binding protein n=1 Tax=Peptostreptococcus faecalis TaxID=2045015 RepID=UPI000C7A6FF6|nr:ATP-binding cassette domain-containing protein [Peptostreptococcus faecalis]